MALTKSERRQRIRYRIRRSITGTSTTPRLSVFRSNKEIYAQLINDVTGETIAAASSREKEIAGATATKIERAALVGKALAAKASEKGIEKCAFDRSGYLYHGRVKSLAEGAREGGLKF
jgi:large subunit ribosomal protein L18